MLRFVVLLVLKCDAQRLWEQAVEDDSSEGKIRAIHIVYNHGHSEPEPEPVDTFPRDPHSNSVIWKQGPGQLTIQGRRQAFNFGQNLKARYRHLIPAQKGFKYVHAMSAKTPRTMMTSAVVLAGLLPPKGEDMWSSIPWQPAPSYHDEILMHNPCPRLETLKKERHEIFNQKLYSHVSKYSGRQITSPHEMLSLYYRLETQNQAGLALPDWVRPVYSQMKREAANSYYHFNDEESRLQIGRVLDRMTNFESYNISRIRLFCTQDDMVGGLLTALRVNQSEPPNYMAALIVELRELKDKFHVQLWYRIGPFDELVPIPWRQCGIQCPLTTLRTILDPLFPKDWSRECLLFQNISDIIYILISIGVLLISVVIFVISGSGITVYNLVIEATRRQKRTKKSFV